MKKLVYLLTFLNTVIFWKFPVCFWLTRMLYSALELVVPLCYIISYYMFYWYQTFWWLNVVSVSAAPLLGSIEFSLLYSALDYTLQCVIHRAKVPFICFSLSLVFRSETLRNTFRSTARLFKSGFDSSLGVVNWHFINPSAGGCG